MPELKFSSSRQADYVYRLIAEYASRQKEALNLYLPLPTAQKFHCSAAKRRICRGSNRAGKTLVGAVEIARIVTGKDPYKKCPEKDGRLLAVGYDGDHIGQVMWRKLAFPGAFWIVQDEITGAWRSVRPDHDNPQVLDPIDLTRKKDWKPAPPLIPPRLIKFIAWDQKKNNIPKRVVLHNGWELAFRTSKGAPEQGVDVNVVWFDEELEREDWYAESVRGLVDREGLFLWTATPQAATEQLLALHEECEKGTPDFAEFHIKIDDNPYLTPEAKRQFYQDMLASGEDSLAVRYFGDYAAHGLRVYGEFNPAIHCCDVFEIPEHWTRYMIIDPGFQSGATLFGAVPDFGHQKHVYDELMIKQCTAGRWADEVQKRIGDGPQFEAFILDKRMGRQSSVITGDTTYEHYWRALEERGIRARISGFVAAHDDINARTEALKDWMRKGPDGLCTLQIHESKCGNLIRQIKAQYFNKRLPDKRVMRNNDLTDDLEYFAAFDPYYREGEKGSFKTSYGVRCLEGQWQVYIRASGLTMDCCRNQQEAADLADALNKAEEYGQTIWKEKQKLRRREEQIQSAAAARFPAMAEAFLRREIA